jgi:beta-galactosidase GanA
VSNHFSIYFFWSYHSASKDVYDFETSGKNIQRVLDYAKEAGIWVIARPGPYANAEANAGGLALWGSDGSFGGLRENSTAYYNAWLPYVTKIGEILGKNEVANGGVSFVFLQDSESDPNFYSACHFEPNRERTPRNYAQRY